MYSRVRPAVRVQSAKVTAERRAFLSLSDRRECLAASRGRTASINRAGQTYVREIASRNVVVR